MRGTRLEPGSRRLAGFGLRVRIDPARPIVDPHHQLRISTRTRTNYLLPDLWKDIKQSGHGINKTVFVECRASYRECGPGAMRPVGETELVARIAQDSRQGGGLSRPPSSRMRACVRPRTCWGQHRDELVLALVGFAQFPIGLARASSQPQPCAARQSGWRA